MEERYMLMLEATLFFALYAAICAAFVSLLGYTPDSVGRK